MESCTEYYRRRVSMSSEAERMLEPEEIPEEDKVDVFGLTLQRRQDIYGLICPNCKGSFLWDHIAGGDECPFCKTYVKASEHGYHQLAYYKKQEIIDAERRLGLELSVFDYYHKGCKMKSKITAAPNHPGKWFCPDCHLVSNIELLLVKVDKGVRP